MENYGEDGDTIHLKDPKDETIKLSEIYSGQTTDTGDYGQYKERIAQLEKELEEFKSAVAQTITSKGIETASDATTETILENLGNLGTIRIAERGTFQTGSLPATGIKTLTINLQNTYKEEDKARLFMYNVIETAPNLYPQIASSAGQVTGNTHRFHIYNNTGAVDSGATVRYVVFTGVEL